MYAWPGFEVPVGKHAAERWGGCKSCNDPKCHPDMCVTGAPVFDWDVPESFDKVGSPFAYRAQVGTLNLFG